MLKAYTVIIISLAFVAGYSANNVIFAQNTSNSTLPPISSNAEAVQVSSTALIGSITSLIIAIGGIAAIVVKFLPVSNRVGQAITMVTDNAQAVYETRDKLGQYIGGGVDFAPGDVQSQIAKLTPIMNDIKRMADEYKQKVDRLKALAAEHGQAVEGVNYGQKFGG